jgi:hypothetical protein
MANPVCRVSLARDNQMTLHFIIATDGTATLFSSCNRSKEVSCYKTAVCLSVAIPVLSHLLESNVTSMLLQNYEVQFFINKKVKIFLQQVVEAHRVVRLRGSHILYTVG